MGNHLHVMNVLNPKLLTINEHRISKLRDLHVKIRYKHKMITKQLNYACY